MVEVVLNDDESNFAVITLLIELEAICNNDVHDLLLNNLLFKIVNLVYRKFEPVHPHR